MGGRKTKPMKPTYDKQYFIDKFAAIPEDRWITSFYADPDDDSRCCAFGHCGVRFLMSGPNDGEEAAALASLLQHRTASINDGQHESYQQPTPKQRILAALNDLP
jgi:hypothetical protein